MKKEYLLQELEELDIVELGRGQIISKEEMNSCPGDYPVYSSSALNNGEFGKYGKFMFDDERITWSIDGGGRLFFRESHKYSVTNVCGWIKVKNKSVLLTKYLYYSLYFQWTLKTFDYTYKAHPSVIRKLYKVKLIPIDEQEKIIKKISEIEDIISKNKLLLPNFDNLIKSRFIEMFGDPQETTKYPKLPLKSTCMVITGNTPSRAHKSYYGNAVEWIKTDNILLNQLYPTKALESLSNEGVSVGRIVEKDSILMACIAGSISSIGRVCLTDRRVAFNQQINAIVPLQYNPFFLYALLGLCKDYLVCDINMAIKGILSKSKLELKEFVVPPMDKQNEFSEFVKLIDKSKFVYHSKNFLWLIFTLLSSTMAYSNVVSIFACPNRC